MNSGRLRVVCLILASSILLPARAPAQAKDEAGKMAAPAKPPFVEKVSRTEHALTLDGQRIAYTATAGTLILRNEEGAPRAAVFSVAYTRDGVRDPVARPVTFAFNGGPGGASVWVHFGAFGPKRVDLDPQGFPLPPPARLVDNENSILDTAAAWYHKKLAPELAGDLRKTLDEAKRFALDEYGPALLQGDWLPVGRRREIAGKLARYTGLSVDYVERSNLRVEHVRFCKELLRDRGQTVGRIDARFTGTDRDSAGEAWEFDPSLTRYDAPFAEVTLDYLRRELGYREDELVYERLTDKVFPWHFPNHENRYADLSEVLRQTMMKNPDLKVFVASGYYDLATPFFDADYAIAHMGLPAADRSRVSFGYYECGHMVYTRPEDHRKLKADMAGFIRNAAGR